MILSVFSNALAFQHGLQVSFICFQHASTGCLGESKLLVGTLSLLLCMCSLAVGVFTATPTEAGHGCSCCKVRSTFIYNSSV